MHLGTLIATCIVFRSAILELILGIFKREPVQLRLMLLIVIASIPTALTGLLLKDFFEDIFGRAEIVSCLLIFTGFILFFTKKSEDKETCYEDVKVWHALLIGLAQSFAILPGISRSGSTIAAALYLKLNRRFAGEFSFLISLPAISGATILTFKDWVDAGAPSEALGIGATLGILTAFLTGLFSLKWLLSFVQSGKLYVFSYYLWIIGFAGLLYFS